MPRRESKELFLVRGARDLRDLERQVNNVLNRLSTYIDERAGFTGPVDLADDLDTKGKRIRNLPIPKEGSEAQRADRALSIDNVPDGLLRGDFFNAKNLRLGSLRDAVTDDDAVNLRQTKRLLESGDRATSSSLLANTGSTAQIQDVDHSAEDGGSASEFARADHKHSMTTAGAGDLAAVDHAAASAGASDSVARADHKHSLSTAAVGVLATLDHAAAAAGSSDDVARGDHKHPLDTAAAGALAATSHAAAAAGTSDQLVRADHKHPVSSAGAGDLARVGLTAAAGSSDTIPRGDHVHPATALLSLDTAFAHTGDTNETAIYSATVSANTLGTDRAVMVFTRLSITNGGSPNTKTVRFKFGGTTLFTITIAAGDEDPRWVRWWIIPDGATNAQESFFLAIADLAFEANSQASGVIDTTVDQDVEVTVQLTDAADTVTGEAFVAEVKTSP